MKRIGIHSVPRSGSTWVGSIFDSHPNVNYKMQPLFSYAFKSALNEYSTKQEIDSFFKSLFLKQDDFLDQIIPKKKGLIPKFKKGISEILVYKEVRYHHILENLLERDTEIKIVGIVRNPLSVIASWIKAPREFREDLGWEIDNEWLEAPTKNLNRKEEYNGYRKWVEVSKLFLLLKEKFPKRFYLLNYDDLLVDTKKEVKDLFRFCGMSYSDQTEKFIVDSTNKNDSDAYSVFKKKSSDNKWKSILPSHISDSIKSDRDFKKLNSIFNWL